MNASLFLRCCWREFCATRVFTLGLLALAAFIQWVIAACGNWILPGWTVDQSAGSLMYTALGLAIVHLVTMAATAFNREQETGTYLWLQALPTRLAPLWWAKVAVPWLGSLLLGLLLIVFARYAVVDWRGLRNLLNASCDVDAPLTTLLASTPWRTWFNLVGLLILFGFTASGLSQVIRQPLVAAVMAGIITCLTFTIFGVTQFAELTRGRNEEALYSTTGLFTLSLLALLANAWVAPRWLGTHASSRPTRVPFLPSAAPVAPSPYAGHTASHWQAMKRLMWTGRTSWWITLALLGCALLLAKEAMELALLGGAALYVYVGGALFSPERSRASGAFLMERGVSPVRLYWSRLLLSGLPPLALLWPILVSFATRDYYSAGFRYLVCVPYFVVAMGQFLSLNIASPLVSITATALLAIVSGVWCVLGAVFEWPFWLLLLPNVPWVIAGRLRATPAMLGWNSWRDWWPAVTALLLGAVATWGAVHTYRVQSIPRPTRLQAQALQPAQWPEPFEAESANLIRRTAEQLGFQGELDRSDLGAYLTDVKAGSAPAMPWHQFCATVDLPLNHELASFWSENVDLLTPELAQAIHSARGLRDFRAWLKQIANAGYLQDTTHDAVESLIRLYLLQAHQQRTSGKLNEAWESLQLAVELNGQRYRQSTLFEYQLADQTEHLILNEIVFWAAEQGQTAEQVERSVTWLHDFWTNRPSIRPSILATREMHRALLQSPAAANFPWNWAPGELTRALRAVDLECVALLNLATGTPVRDSRSIEEMGHWIVRTTPLLQVIGQTFRGEELPDNRKLAVRGLQLLLIAYHHRHGHYPPPADLFDLPQLPQDWSDSMVSSVGYEVVTADNARNLFQIFSTVNEARVIDFTGAQVISYQVVVPLPVIAGDNTPPQENTESDASTTEEGSPGQPLFE